jgi:hypothetical protein
MKLRENKKKPPTPQPERRLRIQIAENSTNQDRSEQIRTTGPKGIKKKRK